MNPTPTPPSLHRLPASVRLRPDVALYATGDGHVLLAGDVHHHVRLDDADLQALLDALLLGDEPRPPQARAALASLVDAGLADPAPVRVDVAGDGVLATALRAALLRMGAGIEAGGTPVAALDDDRPLARLPATTAACWASGHRVVLSPPAVPAAQVAARHRAATVHRDADRRVVPAPGARGVRSAVSALTGAGLELAAVQVAAELLRAERPAHEAVVVDLVALTISRHPVLPVPAAPR
ncbi:hypothetical protein [Nocardioides humi]|uniref:Uncharacterized protein n=1 Tax=Nocardioides humi TaxID=449461 RepID=A0ABN2AAE2_9ACTN|nr:hypothetical protein [Nocardioides humi]